MAVSYVMTSSRKASISFALSIARKCFIIDLTLWSIVSPGRFEDNFLIEFELLGKAFGELPVKRLVLSKQVDCRNDPWGIASRAFNKHRQELVFHRLRFRLFNRSRIIRHARPDKTTPRPAPNTRTAKPIPFTSEVMTPRRCSNHDKKRRDKGEDAKSV